MRMSARNVLKGRVKRIHVGAVNTEVVIDVGGTEIVSIITKASGDSRLRISNMQARWISRGVRPWAEPSSSV